MNTAQNRDALYYPYIHIRDVNWLKATLLAFPHVRRIVPDDFYLNDDEDIRPFRNIKGARDIPLLAEESPFTTAVDNAQHYLRGRIKENIALINSQYSKERTIEQYKQTSTFQIYRSNMMELLEYLEEQGLAWHEWEIRGSTADDWFGIHPKLGEAIMSILAIAVARDKGLDIVTNSGQVHRNLGSLDEEAVLNNLLGIYTKSDTIPLDTQALEMADELIEVVMTNYFDVGRLTPDQIGEISREGYGLQKLKNELLTVAAEIPDIHSPIEREERLKYAAEEVLQNWRKYKKSLPRYALDAIISGMDDVKIPDLVLTTLASIGAGVGTGAATTLFLGGAAGVGIGLLVYSGMNVWRAYKEKTNNPYQFLTRIEKAGATLTLPTVTRRK